MSEELDKEPARRTLSSFLPFELLKAALPLLLVTALVLLVGYRYIDPAPPKRIVISAGKQDSNYYAYARLYAELLKEEGITLEVRESNGSVENLHRLRDPDSGVELAFVQGGIASTEPTVGLVSVGSLYYEPMWIFCHCSSNIAHLSDLKGQRIAIGVEGSGTHVLAKLMLSAAGVTPKNSRLLSIGDEEAAEALQHGKIDLAFFLEVPHSPLIQKVAADKRITLLNLDEAEAYSRQFNFLHHLVIPEGALSLESNLPPHDVHLLAPSVTLVAKDSVHPALIYLLLKSIAKVHGGSGLLQKEHEFPSDKDTDFELSKQAASFFKSGPPFLDKYLPFWAATFVSRMLIILLPLLAVIIPLTRIAPSIYVWLVKSKIYKLYGELRFLETQLQSATLPEERQRYLTELNQIEIRIGQLKLPNAFTHHLYELKSHLNLVRSKLPE